MGSSRTPNSVSTASSRSYISDRTRHHRSSSRHTEVKKPNRKMKFIIAIGIALPIVAAIIGVVAWAVSADTAFQGPIANSLRRSDIHMENHEEDIFQALENRHDAEYSRHFSEPNQNLEKLDFSRLDATDKQRIDDLSRLENIENNNQFDDITNKDPLYVVHFVPSPKPRVESSTNGPLASTVSNEVLQKILSASKGTKPGTPQFVVFAPIPDDEDTKVETEKLEIGSQGINPISNRQHSNGELDYEYEEELRKYQELIDSGNPLNKETSRAGKSKEIFQTRTENIKSPVNFVPQNLSLGNVYQTNQQQLNPNSYSQANNNNQQQRQQQSLVPQHSYQQIVQAHPQAYAQGHMKQPVQVQNYGNQQDNYQQQYKQPVAATHERYVKQPLHPQPQASERSGQYEPVGIKLNFGGGGGQGYLGGNYSPLGIFGSILRPILPRPQVNLNGKVMFGLMLENGLKLGDKGNSNNYGHNYDAENRAGTLEIGSQGINSFSNQQHSNGKIDYDYEEELRKYQELLNTGDHKNKETARAEKSEQISQLQTQNVMETLKLLSQNLTSANIYQTSQQQLPLQNLNLLPQANNFNQQQQQQSLVPQQSYQQNIQLHPQSYAQGSVHQEQPANIQSYGNQPNQYQQQQYQQPRVATQEIYPKQPLYSQPQATERSGQYEPIGIKLNFGGGGGRGLLGGNYSPLGIIGSIVRSLLPKPQVNLNGKVMFGVVLEKGLKLGDRGSH